MGCAGTVIGGFIGLIFFGPIGLFVGALLGSCIQFKSQLLNNAGAQSTGRRYTREELENNFITCLFGLMAKVASADGKVTNDEANVINNFAKQNFPNRLDYIKGVISSSKDPSHTVEYYLKSYTDGWGNNRNIAITLLNTLCDIAMVDGNISDAEFRILLQIENFFGIFGHTAFYIGARQNRGYGFGNGGQQYQNYGGYSGSRRQETTEDQLARHYKTLGVEANASDSELKKAYREKCREWHPDVLQSKGLPPEMLKKAEVEMKNINAAYEAIKKARGI